MVYCGVQQRGGQLTKTITRGWVPLKVSLLYLNPFSNVESEYCADMGRIDVMALLKLRCAEKTAHKTTVFAPQMRLGRIQNRVVEYF